MLKMQKIILLLLCLFQSIHLCAQEAITQNIRGTVVDKDSKMPLIGANILLLDSEPVIGASTDIDGHFKLPNIVVGRIGLAVSYLGYEPIVMNSLMLKSGKELVLTIEMEESANQLQEVVVKADYDKAESLNDMATVSARSFSVEETSRYASSFFDPARMAQNYAGVAVTGGSSDLFNEIMVRGNSPRTVLWRLEGIEIPNPNHFGSPGNSGGGISMLSSSTLSNSDFYTGAFPAEFGNALSGIFDLNMRSGNNEKREYAFMIGALGVEASVEGPFSPGSQASYLINYRYSTLSALEAVGLSPVGDILPKYQDLSFKFNWPTKKAGTFSLFGLGGKNSSFFEPKADSTAWQENGDNEGYTEKQWVGTVGLSHRYLLSDHSYIRTILAASSDRYEAEDYWLEADLNYQRQENYELPFRNNAFRLSSSYTNKRDRKNTFRAGLIVSHLDFDFEFRAWDEEDRLMRTFFDNAGHTQLIQAYGQWKYKLNEHWIFNSGLHYTYFALNQNFAIEPRAAVKWKFAANKALSASVGLHSRPEPLPFYFTKGETETNTESPNKNLELTKSMHAVIAYDHSFSPQLRLKVEAYYQHLYDVPVEKNPTSTKSAINALDLWDMVDAEESVNDGTGRNYGIDLTLEKFFSKQYYFLLTGSLFQSKYTPLDGIEYNTRYNSNYRLNVLAGKEFKLGKRDNKIFGINGKAVLAGGNRYTPIDINQSKINGEAVYYEDRSFEEQVDAYYRIDVGISYKVNKKRMTHSVMLDIQNVTNRLNSDIIFYDEDKEDLDTWYQTGLFPNINYRIEF